MKHGETPGQIHRRHLIALRELRKPQDPDGCCVRIFPWQHLDDWDAKGFKRYLKAKSKAVQRRRDRHAIAEAERDRRAS